jgi:hypothetical protein
MNLFFNVSQATLIQCLSVHGHFAFALHGLILLI